MVIDTKYNIGDNISWKENIILPEMQNCSFCNATGKIQGHDNRVITCPICNGLKKEHKTRTVNQSGKIQGINGQFNTMENLTKIIFRVLDNNGGIVTVNLNDLENS